MEPIDLEIRRRLDRLKEPIQDVPSSEDLEKRLRELKGLPEPSGVSNKYVVLPKPKSQAEQVDNLMEQFSNEVAMSSRASTSNYIDEVDRRLQNLRTENIRSENLDNTRPVNRPEIPRENDDKALLKKILAEADLEKKLERKFPQLAVQPEEKLDEDERMSYSESDSDDEFCTICSNSPKWICKDCDNDMFCTQCYKDYHNELGESHRCKAYNRRKK